MKIRWVIAAFCFVAPAAAFAGIAQVPTLGDVGLIILGVGLLSGGVAALRRRQR